MGYTRLLHRHVTVIVECLLTDLRTQVYSLLI